MPNNGYFDTVFAVDGDTTVVPDATQMDGSVSYEQGFPVAYSTPVSSGGKNYPRYQTNQILKDITAALQNWQQNTIAPFITTSMNGGTPFSYSQYNMVLSGGVGYISLVNGNTDTPPSSKWAVISLGTATFYSGGVSTGSANAQVVSTLAPAGFSLAHDGSTVCCTAGFTNTGATTFALGGTAATAVKKWNGTSYVALTGGEITLNETVFLSVNVTESCLVLTDAPTLGAAAAKAVTDNTKPTVASVTGSFTAGNFASFNDTAGTIKDSGRGMTVGTPLTLTPVSSGSTTSVAHGLGAAPNQCIASLVCLSAEGGYSTGDGVILNGSCLGIFNTDTVYTIWSNASTLGLVTTSVAAIQISRKDTAANFTITPANWQLTVTPILFS